MKLYSTLYKVSAFVLFGLVVSGGTFAYIKAEGNQITVCVKKSGLVYVIGEEFRRSECKKNDSLLSWNTAGMQGLKGDKGDMGPQGTQGIKGDAGDTGPQGMKGDKGDNATHGAGNIAFCSSRYGSSCQAVLKTDGTIWEWTGDIWIPMVNEPRSIPVPVSEVIDWEFQMVLDKNGDVWRWTNNQWVNDGHPN